MPVLELEPTTSIEPPRPVEQDRGRIPGLDGLRGSAILAVLMFYYFTALTAGREGVVGVFHQVFAMGWTGVDLFFVLSGYLIGGILLDARTSGHYFKTFYMRRFFRIMPLYYVWIFGYLLLISIAGSTRLEAAGAVVSARPPVYVYFLFLQNLKDFHLTGMPAAWFGATWSLAVEEQFYLVCPVLIRILPRRVLTAVLIGVVISAPVLRLLVHNYGQAGPELVNTLMPCRADAFAMGILAAIFWRSAKLRSYLAANISILYLLGSIALAGMLIVILKWDLEPWSLGMQTIGFSVIAFFFAVNLLILLMRPRGLIDSVARMGWLREIGAVSYCMYIIHIAVEGFCRDIMLPPSMRQSVSWRSVSVLLLAAFLTYAIAKLSWIVFERPLLRAGHSFRY